MKKSFYVFLVVFVTVIQLYSQTSNFGRSGYWQQKVDYTMEIDMD